MEIVEYLGMKFCIKPDSLRCRQHRTADHEKHGTGERWCIGLLEVGRLRKRSSVLLRQSYY